ncbi:hypothetical protein [Vibrio parahaemolyticus]|uniref:hypothetical protein n=1 Tax=Vibrio parahaemolyticus TaxID=670 RepID=UPI003D81BB31
MCIAGLFSDEMDRVRTYHDIKKLVDHATDESFPLSFIHGYLCNWRTTMGFYDDEKQAATSLQESLHAELFHTYVSMVDTFASLYRDEVVAELEKMAELVCRIDVLEDEDDDHECDDDETDCYHSEYIAERNRANRATRQVEQLSAENDQLRAKLEAATKRESELIALLEAANIEYQ